MGWMWRRREMDQPKLEEHGGGLSGGEGDCRKNRLFCKCCWDACFTSEQ